MLDGIQQGGVRRGAGMAQFDITHPNILDFIYAKKDYRTQQYKRFNFSIRIPDWFYKELEDNPDAPMRVKNVKDNKYFDLKTHDGSTVTIGQLWDKIIYYAWLCGEPGIFNCDIATKQCTVTNVNPLVLSNPCSEFVSIPYSSCNLASLNLEKFVKYGKIDWGSLEKAITIATIFLDKVIDKNIFPVNKIKEVTEAIRPIGLGVMGIAHMFYLLEIPYGSEESKKLLNELLYFITIKSTEISIERARKKKKYKAFDYNRYMKANERIWDNKEGVTFVESIKGDGWVDELKRKIKKNGIRNHSQTSIAPTGSISFIADTSSGIEPAFALAFTRKIEELNGKYKEVYITNPIFDKYLNRHHKKDKKKILKSVVDNCGSCQKCELLTDKEKSIFITSQDLSINEHIDILEISARNTSLSVSKTLNLPKDTTKEEVGKAYIEAYKRGIIGVTVYRDGSREGILISGNKGIEKTQSPKRPNALDAEVFHFVIRKQKYYVVVGLYDDDPYEVFTGANYNNDGEIFIPKSIEHGEIIKVQRGKYILRTDEGNEYSLTNQHTDDNADALTRMISTGLRHGVDLSFVVHQLSKTRGEMLSFAKSLGRSLKKYIKDGTKVSGESCHNCKSTNMKYQDHCPTCQVCGWSKCG